MIRLSKRLNGIYRRYHSPGYLFMDPLESVHKFRRARDIEIAGLVFSAISYGRVEQILANIARIMGMTGPDIYRFTIQTSLSRKKALFKNFKHRFNSGYDIALLFEVIKYGIKKSGTLGTLFAYGYEKGDRNIKRALHNFVYNLREQARKITGKNKRTFEYLLPSPFSGSACKRLNMYLRWMIRKNDGIDFGIWNTVPVSALVIPSLQERMRTGKQRRR